MRLPRRFCARNSTRWRKICRSLRVKIGMLGNRANAVAVAEFLDKTNSPHVVLDPVCSPAPAVRICSMPRE